MKTKYFMWISNGLFVLSSFGFVVIGFGIAMLLIDVEVIDTRIDYQELTINRSVFKINDEMAVGVYNHAGYFCVITKDRSFEEIAQTTFHELAHMYNHRDTEHFLGRYKELII